MDETKRGGGNLPKDGSGVSLQQLLAVAGVTTPPKWVRMTFIGAGGGGGCGKGSQTFIYGGGGGGSGAIAIVETDEAQAVWDTPYPLSVGRGGWYLASDHYTPAGIPTTGETDLNGNPIPDISNGWSPEDTTAVALKEWWVSAPGYKEAHASEPWLWSGDGGDCTWGLPNDGAGVFGVSGGRVGLGPSWESSNVPSYGPGEQTNGARGGYGGAMPAAPHIGILVLGGGMVGESRRPFWWRHAQRRRRAAHGQWR